MDEKIERTEQDIRQHSADDLVAPAGQPEETPSVSSPTEEETPTPAPQETPEQSVVSETTEASLFSEEEKTPSAEEDATAAALPEEKPEAPQAEAAPTDEASEKQDASEAPAEEAQSSDEENAPESQTEEATLPEEETAPDAEEEKDVPLVLDQPEKDDEGQEDAPAPAPAGFAAKLFNGLSCIGFPLLLVLAAAMTFFEVWQVRDLWFSDEVRLADAFMNLRNGDWLMLTMNGLPYPDKPPLYFWFMEALMRIPGVTMPMVFFLAVAVSHALFIGSIWLLARGTGHDRREAFAAGLVALCCVYISGAACYPRMDLLFAAVVTLGMTCLYRGWIKSFAPFWLTIGFLLMGVATLIKSPLGIAFAVVASILFLFWRGTPGRLNGRDGLPGFLLMLLMIAAWLGMLYLEGHQDYLREMLETQLAGRVLQGGHHAQVWWYYLAALPLIWLPWTFLILIVNWFAVLRGVPKVWKTRKTNGGSSWLWIWLVSGVAMLSCVQAKMAVYALPLLAPLAVLTGRSVLRLSPGRSRLFFSLVSIVLAVTGLALVLIDVFPLIRPYADPFLPAVPAMVQPWLETLEGTMYMGGILVLFAVLLLFFTRRALPGGALLVTAVGMIAMLVPYQAFVAPSMDKLLSPRAQAAAMAEKVKEGYAPAAFNVYPGAYAWHLNDILPQNGRRLSVPDLATAADRDAWLKDHPAAVMAMPAADWEAWNAKPADAEVLIRAWMVHKPYVVAAIGSADALKSAPGTEAAPAAAGQNAEVKVAAEASPSAETAAPVTAPEAAATAPAAPEKADEAPAPADMSAETAAPASSETK